MTRLLLAIAAALLGANAVRRANRRRARLTFNVRK